MKPEEAARAAEVAAEEAYKAEEEASRREEADKERLAKAEALRIVEGIFRSQRRGVLDDERRAAGRLETEEDMGDEEALIRAADLDPEVDEPERRLPRIPDGYNKGDDDI